MPPATNNKVSWLPRGGAAGTLLFFGTGAVAAIFYSHYAQVRDKSLMREGVERDKARLRQRKKLKEQQRPGHAE